MSAATDPPITEADWQQQVIDLAHVLGWKHLHVRRTIGKGNKWVTATNLKGWPDLFLWHERQQRVIAAELKSEAGTTTPEQVDVLESLTAAGVPCFVWRPSDLEAVRDLLATPTRNTPLPKAEDRP